MAKQRNVQQQNALTRDGIVAAAASFAMHRAEMAWLEAVLLAHGLDPGAGMLAALYMIPEQEGHWCQCVWLSGERRFWKITAVLDYHTHELAEVEEFSDVTASTPVQQHTRGTGASFGWLAVQVLEELSGGVQPSVRREDD